MAHMNQSYIFYRIIGVYPPPAALKFSAEFKFAIETTKRWELPIIYKYEHENIRLQHHPVVRP